jgi:hypothetical protein
MQVVVLPSGHKAPLEPADARRLLACGGTINGLCHAVWAHPELEVVEALSCGTDDAITVAMWAIQQFLDTDEAGELAAVCEFYHDTPSARLGLTDRVLAYALDQGCFAKLLALREGAKGDSDHGFNSGVNNG